MQGFGMFVRRFHCHGNSFNGVSMNVRMHTCCRRSKNGNEYLRHKSVLATFTCNQSKPYIHISNQRQQQRFPKRDYSISRSTGSKKSSKSKSISYSLDESLEKQLKTHAIKPATGVSLQQLLQFGSNPTEMTLLRASVFLHHELPIRLAKKALELENLPYGLSNMPSIKEVRRWYVTSFKEITEFPRPDSFSSERKFTNLVKEIYERHSGVLWTMAKGIYELKSSFLKSEHAGRNSSTDFALEKVFPEVQAFLDNFFLSRVGIRVLIGQHIALHENIDGWVGLICVRTSPSEIARNAVKAASQACLIRYGRVPNVIITGDLDRDFPYIPAHLHHILFELLKNSMRAVVEHHGLEKEEEYPEIKIVIIDREENEDVCIKVMDEGGGIPRADLQKVWSYMYTTAVQDAKEVFDSLESGRDFAAYNLPLAGMGYGLPVSRVFARYLGGDINIVSMEGFGTDAYVYMRSLGDSEEPMP
mmetsp:Transcript_11990/g.13958  ORF Transcript_11990/g.13958 Transcript_11990/m.13958 type:complete len:474 (-) Transcript_11990:96-1517(-)